MKNNSIEIRFQFVMKKFAFKLNFLEQNLNTLLNFYF